MKLPTEADFNRVFNLEKANTYPAIDDFERRKDYHIDRDELEIYARYLACPVKKNPPCWQHGRVIYSTIRRYIRDHDYNHLHRPDPDMFFVDIGTAKGFSAMIMAKAAYDAGLGGYSHVYSTDVINPNARVFRNTLADLDGSETLYEILHGFHFEWIEFFGKPGLTMLQELHAQKRRINFAFVDGKHTTDAVAAETNMISKMQHKGDIIIWDDAQIAGVSRAIEMFTDKYAMEHIFAIPGMRSYIIGYRK